MSSPGRGVVGLLVCVVATMAVAVLAPNPATDARTQDVDVTVGQVGRGRLIDAEVTRVRVVTGVRAYEGSDPLTTDGRLVVVDVRLAVRRQPAQLQQIHLLTADGRSYAPRPEFSTAGPVQTQPGFTRVAELVFELPTDRVVGSTLVVDADQQAFVGYDVSVHIDLGLTSTTAATKPILLRGSTVELTR